MTKRIIALLLALILTVGLLPTVALAKDAPEGEQTASSTTTDTKYSGADSEQNADNPVHIVKSATTDADGNGTLKLEAYVTDPMTITTHDVPLDIVLVLDQSGSMGFCINCGEETGEYKGGEWKNKSQNCPLTKTYEFVGKAQSLTSGEYYAYKEQKPKKVTYCDGNHFGWSHQAGWYWANKIFHDSWNRLGDNADLYKQVTKTSKHVHRLDTLKTVLTSFTNSVETRATDAKVAHRIAMVGFASDSNDYNNTEILTGVELRDGNKYNYNDYYYFPAYTKINGVQKSSATTTDYKNALVDVSQTAGQSSVTAAIGALTAQGGTQTGDGLKMAAEIFKNNPLTGNDEGRKRIVILFTDGDSDNENAAEEQANALKNTYKATVYTVGLFADADQTKTNGNNGFLQNVSSNNGKAPKEGEKSYYLAANDAISLQKVFEQITEEVNKLMLDVGTKSVLSDTLSEQFDFDIPADGDLSSAVKFTLVPVDSKNDDGTFTWNEVDAQTITTPKLTKGEGKSFTVTGFDYGANKITRVYNHDGEITGYTGNKLVIEIPIKADTTKTTGWTAGKKDYPTNLSTDDAKLSYKDEKGNDRSTTVESPKAHVTGYTVTYAYGTGSEQPAGVNMPADTRAYIDGQTIKVMPASTAPDGYTFDGWYTDAACTPTNKVDAANPPAINKANRTLYGKFTKSVFPVDLSAYIKKHLTLNGNISALPNPESFEITLQEFTMNGGTKTNVGTAITARTAEIVNTTSSDVPFTVGKTGKLELSLSVGTHTFDVTEKAGSTDKMSYGTTSQTLTVTVGANGAVTDVNPTGGIIITNTYNPDNPEFDLTGKFQKHLTSNTADVPSKSFELTITGTSDNTDKSTITGTAAVGTLTASGTSYTGSANFTFKKGTEAVSALTFTAPGEYKYEVKEVKPTDPVAGMKYDDTAYTLTITVADNQAGALEVTKAEITGGVYTIENPLNLLADNSKLTITNTFTAAKLPLDPDPATGTFKIVKHLTGDTTTQTFTATITEKNGKIASTTGTAEDVTTNTDVSFTNFGTLVFNTFGEYTFTIKEIEPTDKVPGMTYDTTEHTMVVSVAPIDNKHMLAVSSVTIDDKRIDFAATTPWLTINNEYKTPSTGTVTKRTIHSDMSEIGDGIMDTLLVTKGAYIPASDTIVVDKNTNEVTLAYEVSIVGEATATAEVKDDGAEYVTYDSNVDGVSVNYNETTKIATVTFAKAATAKLYYVKTFTRENGKFATAKNVVTVNDGEPVSSDETTITDKDPGSFDFSEIIRKELKLTGSKSFTGAEFEATLTLKDFKQVVPFNSMLTTYADEHVEAWPEGWSRTLVAKFDTTAVDGSTTNFLTTDGNHLFLDFPAAGTYKFELQETNKTSTNVTYDDTVYTVVVEVAADNQDSNMLVVTRIDALYTDEDGNVAEKVIYISGETKSDVVTFVNTVDTGKDDYYPIIIPTIINKDTGMLNKTDHFAYVIGYPDGTVHPNGQITRAEVATIFFRLLRDEVRDGAFTTSNSYSDVAYGKWYNNPISTMSALGIITGYPDGTFKPNKPITRAEFAAIAARFDETQSGKSATFSDVIGHWAAKEIGIAYYNDWIKGYPDGTFKPDQNITRAEAMTLINRVLERKPESPADLLTNMNKWTDNMDTSKWYYLDVQEATNSHGYTRKTFNYELWRQMLPDPDWSRYER